MTAQWTDQDRTYPDRRASATLSPDGRRFAEVLTHVSNRDSDLPTLYADIVTYWRDQDRASGRTVPSRMTYEDDLAGAYILGRTDAHLLAQDDDDRPSGVLAIVTGILFGVAVCAVLFASGLILGAVRWGW